MAGVEFRAGKMKLVSGQLRPDNRKGMVKLAQSPEDQLLHLTWRNRENGVVEDDRIIFPGDATYAYVEQARGNSKNSRVYVLKFSDSAERLFFWMQEPSDAKDEEYCTKVNAKISGEGPAGGEANMGQLDQNQLLAMLTRGQQQAQADAAAAPSSGPAPAAPDASSSSAAESSAMSVEPAAAPTPAQAGAGAQGALNTANLASILANLGQGGGAGRAAAQHGPSLEEVGAGAQGALNTANLASILANLGQGAGAGRAAAQHGPSLEEVVEPRGVLSALAGQPELQSALLAALPESDRSPDGLREALLSPQFAQAVHQVDRLLQSGQGAPIFLSLQLPPPPPANSYGPAAVRSLVSGLEKQAEEKEKMDGPQ
eukprot:CAMPEP_0202853860 /NCGR_PEP_ID=MMETSP1389-20130828/90702_1 /ASSEMBLY_ACC=CAM_ASM_000865 /TAXON_ID=302021 /ORGANISM="Rhodomonas sp., Strain CCMP768" /LENGTH=370 /DNA_ID=CAMNT_0049532427 /DNA_START=31 /DNA_END=1143 /DNA_ORIENTATION=+